MFNARDQIDNGIDLNKTCYPTYTPPFTFIDSTQFDQYSDCDEGEVSFSSSNSSDSEGEKQLNNSGVVT